MKLGTLTVAATLSVLTFLPAGSAQEAPGIPDSLEQMLKQALMTNPDLALADAAVRAAQAEMNQRRLKVAQQVAMLYHDRKRLLNLKAELSENVERVKTIASRGVIGMDDVREAVLALADADAKLAQAEAEIRYVLGLDSRITISFADETSSVPARNPTEIRKAVRSRPHVADYGVPWLANKMMVDWQNRPLPEILGLLQAATDDELAFLLGPQMDPADMAEYRITLKLPKPVSLELALKALGDFLRYDEFCFVFKEYGVVLMSHDDAEEHYAPTIPEDIPLRVRGR